MHKLGRAVDRLSHAAGYLGALVLLGIIVLTMTEVVSRYGLNRPLILSDEFGGYALVAISCLGLAYCAQDGGHIRITFLVERLGRASGPLRVATLVLGLVFVSLLAWVCWQFLADSFARNMRSNSLLMVPLKWPQLAMPVGFTLYAVVLLVQLVRAWRELRAGRSVDRFGAGER
ncbi:MAG TPA: TRAP transporter small permease [Burkholderiales bacterium]|nr:TRAP transporter small permease [Burkholderiales bacterium]